jgi:hypothetical protein
LRGEAWLKEYALFRIVANSSWFMCKARKMTRGGLRPSLVLMRDGVGWWVGGEGVSAVMVLSGDASKVVDGDGGGDRVV